VQVPGLLVLLVVLLRWWIWLVMGSLIIQTQKRQQGHRLHHRQMTMRGSGSCQLMWLQLPLQMA
jgi:hypothetical protein